MTIKHWAWIVLTVVVGVLFIWGAGMRPTEFVVADSVWHCTVGWYCPPNYAARALAYGIFVAGRGLWGLVSYLFLFGVLAFFAGLILIGLGRPLYRRVRGVLNRGGDG